MTVRPSLRCSIPRSLPTSRSLSNSTSLSTPIFRAAKSEISLEILRDGHVEGRSQPAFNDEIKNTAVENGTMSGKGEQKHEFPYMANIRDASFGAGQYEARLTIRQGRNTVTRGVPFRVVPARL